MPRDPLHTYDNDRHAVLPPLKNMLKATTESIVLKHDSFRRGCRVQWTHSMTYSLHDQHLYDNYHPFINEHLINCSRGAYFMTAIWKHDLNFVDSVRNECY